MGLDQFIKASKTEPIGKCNGRAYNDADIEVAYFRKHPNLHGWMQDLWEESGGELPDWTSFNGDYLELDTDDLETLKAVTEADALPPTQGFFFGETQPYHKQDTLDAIEKCLAKIKEGYFVYYGSSW